MRRPHHSSLFPSALLVRLLLIFVGPPHDHRNHPLLAAAEPTLSYLSSYYYNGCYVYFSGDPNDWTFDTSTGNTCQGYSGPCSAFGAYGWALERIALTDTGSTPTYSAEAPNSCTSVYYGDSSSDLYRTGCWRLANWGWSNAYNTWLGSRTDTTVDDTSITAFRSINYYCYRLRALDDDSGDTFFSQPTCCTCLLYTSPSPRDRG